MGTQQDNREKTAPTAWQSGCSIELLLITGGLVAKSCPNFTTLWTLAHQAPLSTGFSRQESWSGLPFLSPRDSPNPGIEPWSPVLQPDSLPTEL